ncbi:MAG: hypothetical protein OEN49_08710 [Gammaproteobacteria bacterium]|nr:hypothetical protein [Gammaproteobacteria bacterium]
MGKIIGKNIVKSAFRFSSGAQTPGAVNTLQPGMTPSAAWANWVTNFINNFSVSEGSMNYDGRIASLEIDRPNVFGQCTRNADTATVVNVGELAGYDFNAGGTGLLTTISDGTGTKSGFNSASATTWVAAVLNSGSWTLERLTVLPTDSSSTKMSWLLAQITETGNEIVAVKQLWYGGAIIYSHI